MAFTLQELSDRAEIQDLLVREAHALDKGAWEAWERCFTPDAEVDYSENDGARGDPKTIRAWLAAVFSTFPAAQHLSSNSEILLDGDRASARTMQYIAVRMQAGDDERVVLSGIWFHDSLRRDEEGWRISRRYEELAWRHNFPSNFEPPDPTNP